MKWKMPPDIKIYEALGAVVDERIEVDETTGKCYSSSGNKYYDVTYDPKNHTIMTNDNGSYWKGYLGYPAIAFLMKIGELPYDDTIGSLLKGIAWKDINQKFNNDFEKTLQHICDHMSEENIKRLEEYARSTRERIEALDLGLLGKKILPPEGY